VAAKRTLEFIQLFGQLPEIGERYAVMTADLPAAVEAFRLRHTAVMVGVAGAPALAARPPTGRGGGLFGGDGNRAAHATHGNTAGCKMSHGVRLKQVLSTQDSSSKLAKLKTSGARHVMFGGNLNKEMHSLNGNTQPTSFSVNGSVSNAHTSPCELSSNGLVAGRPREPGVVISEDVRLKFVNDYAGLVVKLQGCSERALLANAHRRAVQPVLGRWLHHAQAGKSGAQDC
jgi:hypothetical protein